MSRPTRSVIDLNAVRSNFKLAQSIAPQSNVLAVVKANAYGHGAVQVAKAIEDIAPAFAVACIEEALELRDANIQKPILLLEGVFSQEEMAIAEKENFWLMVDNQQQLELIKQHPGSNCLTVWLGLDSGMHRLGFLAEQFINAYQQLNQCKQIKGPIVLASHFANADDLDSDFTQHQIDVFNQTTSSIDAPKSLANSAALLSLPKTHHQWVRPGFMLYGGNPFSQDKMPGDLINKVEKLKPAMSLLSKLISVRNIKKGESVGYGCTWVAQKDSVIATATIGYGDGYPRVAQNGTPVWIKNQRALLAGRVSMDMLSIDVTHIKDVNIGDDVELWGEHIDVHKVAQHSGSIAYELLTRMPSRAHKQFKNET